MRCLARSDLKELGCKDVMIQDDAAMTGDLDAIAHRVDFSSNPKRCPAPAKNEFFGRQHKRRCDRHKGHGKGLKFVRPDNEQSHQQHKHDRVADRDHPTAFRFHRKGRILRDRPDNQGPYGKEGKQEQQRGEPVEQGRAINMRQPSKHGLLHQTINWR